MQLLVYLIAYPFLWIISKLPFPILYFFSDCIYVLVYKIIGYRTKVVRSNLQLAFPKKSKEDLLKIEKKFYHHLCDVFLEMIKTMSMSEAEMKKRYQFTNFDLLLDLESRKSTILNTSHYGSWEWAVMIGRFVKSKPYGVYLKIENKYFDRLVQRIRAKFDTTLIETKDTIKIMTENQEKNLRALYGFASDQSPMLHKTHHWNKFMGVKVPIHTGAEMLAKKLDLAVIYMQVRKVKRGYYSATFEILAENARDFKDYEISDMFIKKLEEQIIEAPAYYFWTHKRWKHKDHAPKDA